MVEFGTTTRAGKACHLPIIVPRKVTIWTVFPCHDMSAIFQDPSKENAPNPFRPRGYNAAGATSYRKANLRRQSVRTIFRVAPASELKHNNLERH